MQPWQQHYLAEVERLEFEGKAQLLAQIQTAGEHERGVWLQQTEQKLTEVKRGLLEALSLECSQKSLHNPAWQEAQQEFVALFRLRAALEGRDPDQTRQQSPLFPRAMG
jgi:hypothetical protein